MAFCKYSTEYVASSKTEVDNIFMDSFLPFADPVSVKVYLYGLYKCSSPSSFDNSLESFAKTLNMSEDEVVGAFEYWQEQGLVQVLKTSPMKCDIFHLKMLSHQTSFTNLKSIRFSTAKHKRFLKLNEKFQKLNMANIMTFQSAIIWSKKLF